MTFNKDDAVVVMKNCESYGGRYNNLLGIVTLVYPERNRIGVLLDGYRDVHYFKLDELKQLKSAQGIPRAPYLNQFSIKDVIFNDPAVIIRWNDGTKTVVKCGENDIFDPEKGLAMAISKKALGNQGNYYNTFRKYLSVYDEEEEAVSTLGAEFWNNVLGALYGKESK